MLKTAKCCQQQSPSIFKAVIVKFPFSFLDVMRYPSQEAKCVAWLMICIRIWGTVQEIPREDYCICLFLCSAEKKRGQSWGLISSSNGTMLFLLVLLFQMQNFTGTFSLRSRYWKGVLIVSISEKMSKLGIEISPGIVNALNWSTNSSTSITLTDIYSIDLFQNDKLGSRVRPMNWGSLSLFLQWYFEFFTFSQGKTKWKWQLLFTFLRLEVSWVRLLEEAIPGACSQLPGAVPTSGYRMWKSTGLRNSCGLAAAGEVCDPHSSQEISGTCLHDVVLSGERWDTSDQAALSLCCWNTKVHSLVGSLLLPEVLWHSPRHWCMWRNTDQPADFSLDLDGDLSDIHAQDAGFDISGTDGDHFFYVKKKKS